MTVQFKPTNYRGLLIIGDPHLECRVPGFRKDDYPNVILDKLRWCLSYAASESLLPAILGDLFHLPRDNPNWMLVKLIELFQREVIAVYGNHDVHENEISEHDSLSVLAEAGRIQLLDSRTQFYGIVGSRPVVVGGTPWGQRLPDHFGVRWNDEQRPLVFWLAHHDIVLPGYEELGRFHPKELQGIDVVINGHIHRRLETVQVGSTLWLTPGNISRRSRSDTTCAHVPSVLRIDIDVGGWKYAYIEVPHKSYEEVFHEELSEDPVKISPSAFVVGLTELQRHQTQGGAGLVAFLDHNLHQFDEEVASEIRLLAQEVIRNG